MRELNAMVVKRAAVGPRLLIMRVAAEQGALPAFVPGQFILLGLLGSAPRLATADPEEEQLPAGRVIRRAYSIASSSRAGEYLEFLVTLVRSGALTPRLFALKEGDRLWLGPRASGVFTLAEIPRPANVILIASGTGLAPYMSMLRTHVGEEPGRRYAVLHGARHSADLGYQEELVALARAYPSFTYIPTVSQPDEEPDTWKGETGRVQEIWNQRILSRVWGCEPRPSDTHIFLCGNPSMVEEMLVLLGREGFRERTRRHLGEVHTERYW